jgi:hypothetical protein
MLNGHCTPLSLFQNSFAYPDRLLVAHCGAVFARFGGAVEDVVFPVDLDSLVAAKTTCDASYLVAFRFEYGYRFFANS